jgi:DNA processing protein
MKKDDLIYYLGFSYCLGIGPMTFAALKVHPKGVSGAYTASAKELAPMIGQRLTEKFLEFRRKFDPVKELERLRKNGILVLAVDDEDYPESLKNISDPPICLYVRGNLDSVANFFHTRVSPLRGPLESEKKFTTSSSRILFSIVGTRQPTPYGVQIAYKFSRELAESGFIIVSGLAKGIDAIAHKASLDAEGKTIAVLGCGVDIIYPAENDQLYRRIIEKNSLIISEFPPGQTVVKGLFIARNRIISGLSKGVMIVEGTKDSGSLITARYAAEQGKDIFAPPSPITSNMSAAPNLLLKQGAKLVTSIEDILEEFDMKITPRKKEDIRKNLNEIGKLIFDILQKNPQTVDDLAIGLGKTIPEVLNAISVMEIKGVVEKNLEKKYQIRI